jgi:hypothetical protein
MFLHNQQTQARFSGGYDGCIQCHFHQHILDKTDYEYPSNFDASKYLVAFSFHEFCQFNKLQMPFEAMVEKNTNIAKHFQ